MVIGGDEGGDAGAFTEMELESSSDILGLMLENGYSEYSLFLGGTALVIVAVSTVIIRFYHTDIVNVTPLVFLVRSLNKY